MGFKLPSKKIAIAALALGISLIGVFFNAQATHAATYSWINRQDILSSDNVIFRDVNTLDNVVEYEEMGPRACHSHIRFTGFNVSRTPNYIDWDKVHKFYYGDADYDATKRTLIINNPTETGAGQTQCSEQAPQDNIDVANKQRRRVVFFKDTSTDSIINIITQQTFVRKGDFSGVARYFSSSELSPTEHCPDAIILKAADADYDDFWGGPAVAGSSTLYAVKEDSNLGRRSPSYNNINPPNGGNCRVQSEQLKNYKLLAYGEGQNDADNILAANGFNADGSYIGGNKDAFVIFVGDSSNLPPSSAVQLPPANTRCQVPGKGSLLKDDPNCAGEQPQVCTTGDGLAGALSWIICPITDMISKATNFVETHLILPFLGVNPLTTDSSDPRFVVYQIWDSFRNIANVLFIVAFFIIIFSQATSVGLSSYGIKRLLPRLIIVAIATNLSFFIVAFAIDVFNLVGQGIGSLLTNTVLHPTDDLKASYPTVPTTGANGWQWLALTGGLLIGSLLTGTAGALLGWLFSLLLVAAGIVFIAVVVLVIRQMLILLLVVVAPLAMVAWLLPNTEKYFSKWWELLLKLLMMYPLIVLIFAFGKILGQFFATNNVNFTSGSTGQEDQLLRLALQFLSYTLPLIFVPAAFMGAGGVIGKVRDWATKSGGAMQGAAQKGASEFIKNQQGRMAARGADQKGLKRFMYRGLSGNVLGSPTNTRRRMASMGTAFSQPRIKDELDSFQRQGISNDSDALLEIARTTGNLQRREAALMRLASMGSDTHLRDFKTARSDVVSQRMLDRAISSNYGDISAKAPDLAGKAWEKISAEGMPKLSNDSMARGMAASPEFRESMKRAMADPRIRSQISPILLQGKVGGPPGVFQLDLHTAGMGAAAVAAQSTTQLQGIVTGAGGAQNLTNTDLDKIIAGLSTRTDAASVALHTALTSERGQSYRTVIP